LFAKHSTKLNWVNYGWFSHWMLCIVAYCGMMAWWPSG